jgi:hypothetical protein
LGRHSPYFSEGVTKIHGVTSQKIRIGRRRHSPYYNGVTKIHGVTSQKIRIDLGRHSPYYSEDVTKLHGVTTQNTVIFILTVART